MQVEGYGKCEGILMMMVYVEVSVTAKEVNNMICYVAKTGAGVQTTVRLTGV